MLQGSLHFGNTHLDVCRKELLRHQITPQKSWGAQILLGRALGEPQAEGTSPGTRKAMVSKWEHINSTTKKK